MRGGKGRGNAVGIYEVKGLPKESTPLEFTYSQINANCKLKQVVVDFIIMKTVIIMGGSSK